MQLLSGVGKEVEEKSAARVHLGHNPRKRALRLSCTGQEERKVWKRAGESHTHEIATPYKPRPGGHQGGNPSIGKEAQGLPNDQGAKRRKT